MSAAPKTVMTTEHGYRRPGQNITHVVSERDANEGYMTAEQYARRRAEATGGEYVRRSVVVITAAADWEVIA